MAAVVLLLCLANLAVSWGVVHLMRQVTAHGLTIQIGWWLMLLWLLFDLTCVGGVFWALAELI